MAHGPCSFHNACHRLAGVGPISIALLALATCHGALAQADAPAAAALALFSTASVGAPPAAWRGVALPDKKIPASRFDITLLDGRTVLRLRADKSYGTLTHAISGFVPTARILRWQWRLDQPLAHSDLRRKDGDDAALKVCAMFDLPLEKLSFGERSLLRIARSVSGEDLPSATLCYVWDTALPVGTLLPNAFSRRVRYMVLESGSQSLGRWAVQQRDIGQDFLKAFADETDTIAPLRAIAVGADADNTGGSSLGYLGDLTLQELP
jgi:hypothetical protein